MLIIIIILHILNKYRPCTRRCHLRKKRLGINVPKVSAFDLIKYSTAQHIFCLEHPTNTEFFLSNNFPLADKARYLHELANYVPPPGYDVKGDAIMDHTMAPGPGRPGRKSSGAKTQRDPNAPKRNMSAYLLYQNCMREQFKVRYVPTSWIRSFFPISLVQFVNWVILIFLQHRLKTPEWLLGSSLSTLPTWWVLSPRSTVGSTRKDVTNALLRLFHL